MTIIKLDIHTELSKRLLTMYKEHQQLLTSNSNPVDHSKFVIIHIICQETRQEKRIACLRYLLQFHCTSLFNDLGCCSSSSSSSSGERAKSLLLPSSLFKVFDQLVQYFYCCRLILLTENIVPIWELAQRYKLRSIEVECSSFLHNVSLGTVCALLDDVIEHNVTVGYVDKFLDQVRNEFDSAFLLGYLFSVRKVETLKAILKGPILTLSETHVLQLICDWVSKDEMNRLVHVNCLLSFVDWNLVSDDTIVHYMKVYSLILANRLDRILLQPKLEFHYGRKSLFSMETCSACVNAWPLSHRCSSEDGHRCY